VSHESFLPHCPASGLVSLTSGAVIFGEIVPQSICVRYGLSIGAFMKPFVLTLMWIMCPVAYPTAKLLDYLLGEDHGTLYKKAGLKTLVQLHKTLPSADQLMQDEVTIISSVLDLKDKPVVEVMTPMQDVFTMSADTVLDEKMMDIILSQGYSRIPIHVPDNEQNFIGMLLVKILIPYDPEDCLRVRDFALATLPETKPNTSCLDILNYFQEGKSHMVLVSEYPGTSKGALGVVTLEDVIEELIGEEIIDESDVFVDVHKAIRRIAPAPKSRFGKYGHDHAHSDREGDGRDIGDENSPLLAPAQKAEGPRKAMQTTFLMRRRSSAASDSTHATLKPVPVRGSTTEMKQHLKHLGPSNAASRPKTTKFSAVKIKPGAAIEDAPDRKSTTTDAGGPAQHASLDIRDHEPDVLQEGGVNHAGASDGAVALHIQSGYGTIENAPAANTLSASQASQQAKKNTVAELTERAPLVHSNSMSVLEDQGLNQGTSPLYSIKQPDRLVGSTGDLISTPNRLAPARHKARSGSITETMVESEGIRKYVLETNSSSSEEAEEGSPVMGANGTSHTDAVSDEEQTAEGGLRKDGADSSNGKKRRKKRGKRKKGDGVAD
jgi:metal transporter CNNM